MQIRRRVSERKEVTEVEGTRQRQGKRKGGRIKRTHVKTEVMEDGRDGTASSRENLCPPNGEEREGIDLDLCFRLR